MHFRNCLNGIKRYIRQSGLTRRKRRPNKPVAYNAPGEVLETRQMMSVTNGLSQEDRVEAYELDSELRLYTEGNLFENHWKLGEKWLKSNAENAYYYILPNGDVFATDKSLVASLSPEYHADPTLLTEAVNPHLEDLTPDERAFELDTALSLRTTSSYWEDWSGLGEKWMRSSIENRWYYIEPNGDLYKWNSGTKFFVATLSPEFHSDPALLHEAPDPNLVAGDPAARAFELDQSAQLFKHKDKYFENAWFVGEKWLQSAADSSWYYILPTGDVMHVERGHASFVTTLSPEYHKNPELLHEAINSDTSVDEAGTFHLQVGGSDELIEIRDVGDQVSVRRTLHGASSEELLPLRRISSIEFRGADSFENAPELIYASDVPLTALGKYRELIYGPDAVTRVSFDSGTEQMREVAKHDASQVIRTTIDGVESVETYKDGLITSSILNDSDGRRIEKTFESGVLVSQETGLTTGERIREDFLSDGSVERSVMDGGEVLLKVQVDSAGNISGTDADGNTLQKRFRNGELVELVETSVNGNSRRTVWTSPMRRIVEVRETRKLRTLIAIIPGLTGIFPGNSNSDHSQNVQNTSALPELKLRQHFDGDFLMVEESWNGSRHERTTYTTDGTTIHETFGLSGAPVNMQRWNADGSFFRIEWNDTTTVRQDFKDDRLVSERIEDTSTNKVLTRQFDVVNKGQKVTLEEVRDGSFLAVKRIIGKTFTAETAFNQSGGRIETWTGRHLFSDALKKSQITYQNKKKVLSEKWYNDGRFIREAWASDGSWSRHTFQDDEPLSEESKVVVYDDGIRLTGHMNVSRDYRPQPDVRVSYRIMVVNGKLTWLPIGVTRALQTEEVGHNSGVNVRRVTHYDDGSTLVRLSNNGFEVAWARVHRTGKVIEGKTNELKGFYGWGINDVKEWAKEREKSFHNGLNDLSRWGKERISSAKSGLKDLRQFGKDRLNSLVSGLADFDRWRLDGMDKIVDGWGDFTDFVNGGYKDFDFGDWFDGRVSSILGGASDLTSYFGDGYHKIRNGLADFDQYRLERNKGIETSTADIGDYSRGRGDAAVSSGEDAIENIRDIFQVRFPVDPADVFQIQVRQTAAAYVAVVGLYNWTEADEGIQLLVTKNGVETVFETHQTRQKTYGGATNFGEAIIPFDVDSTGEYTMTVRIKEDGEWKEKASTKATFPINKDTVVFTDEDLSPKSGKVAESSHSSFRSVLAVNRDFLEIQSTPVTSDDQIQIDVSLVAYSSRTTVVIKRTTSHADGDVTRETQTLTGGEIATQGLRFEMLDASAEDHFVIEVYEGDPGFSLAGGVVPLHVREFTQSARPRVSKEVLRTFKDYNNLQLTYDEALLLNHLIRTSNDIQQTGRDMLTMLDLGSQYAVFEALGRNPVDRAKWLVEKLFSFSFEDLTEPAIGQLVSVGKKNAWNNILTRLMMNRLHRSELDEELSGFVARPKGDNYHFFKALLWAIHNSPE